MPIDLETYSNARLQPKIRPSDARTQAVRLGANLTVPLGQLLAKKTSDGKFYPYLQPNRVQTLKIAGALTAGTYRIVATDKDGKRVSTTALAYNANAAAITAALVAALGAGAVVATIPTDYATGIVLTFSGTNYAGKPQSLVSADIGSLTGATNYTVEDSTVLSGLEAPKAFNIYPCVTDAQGNVYLSDSAVASSINMPHQTTQVYESGTFDPDELVGFDEAALKAMGGRHDIAGFVVIPN